jgi:HSP20 family protein
MEREPQTVPGRIYQTENQIMLAAPMPGLEAQDITVSINDRTVTITGQERGPGQHGLELALCEWTIGPYFREIVLDQAVDGVLTSATYGNGVLVLNMPKAADGEPMPANFRLNRIDATRGERIGIVREPNCRSGFNPDFLSVG